MKPNHQKHQGDKAAIGHRTKKQDRWGKEKEDGGNQTLDLSKLIFNYLKKEKSGNQSSNNCQYLQEKEAITKD